MNTPNEPWLRSAKKRQPPPEEPAPEESIFLRENTRWIEDLPEGNGESADDEERGTDLSARGRENSGNPNAILDEMDRIWNALLHRPAVYIPIPIVVILISLGVFPFSPDEVRGFVRKHWIWESTLLGLSVISGLGWLHWLTFKYPIWLTVGGSVVAMLIWRKASSAVASSLEPARVPVKLMEHGFTAQWIVEMDRNGDNGRVVSDPRCVKCDADLVQGSSIMGTAWLCPVCKGTFMADNFRLVFDTLVSLAGREYRSKQRGGIL